MEPRSINWVIKVSKLCNLRCSYCYEWNELDTRDRLSLPQWEKLLIAIRQYHELRHRQTGVPPKSNIIWHGGEPMLLPVSYVREVLDLERSIFGADRLASGEFRNALQTNLFKLKDDYLALFEENIFDLGVSFDAAPGLRLSLSGQSTEGQVAKNMDVLRGRGIRFGAIAVLAPHTADRITDIYDYFEALRISARFLPLFNSPRSGEPGIAITEPALGGALKALFDHWIRRPDPVRISPLYDYCFAVYLHLRGERQAPYDRRQSGEWALLVNTNGDLYQRIDAYDRQRSLGNLFVQPIDEILASENYDASLRRDDTIWRRYCRGCKFEGPCPSIDVFDSPREDHGTKRCGIAYALYQHILKYVEGRGGMGERGLEEFLCRM
jgi:uncharacterized protein